MSRENPWKTLGSRCVYKNDWITVREDAVLRPDGREGIYGVVEARVAVGVLALTSANELYLVGQYRYPVKEYSWEIIEGGSDPCEDPLDTARRELKEEAGLEALQWIQLGGEIHLTNCHSSEKGVFYLAKELSIGESSPDATEILEIKKLPFSEVRKMLEHGDIKDAMSIIGINRLDLYLQKKC